MLNLDFTLNGLATDSPYKNTLSCGGPDSAVEESQAGRRKQGNRILRRGRFRVRGNLGMVKWRCGFHDKVQKKKNFMLQMEDLQINVKFCQKKDGKECFY